MREEIEARGWSMKSMCIVSMLKQGTVEELCAERIRVTPVIARCLALAFGTSHEMWLNLQAQFDGKHEKRGK